MGVGLLGLIKGVHSPCSSLAIPVFSTLGASGGVGVLLKMNRSLSPKSLFPKNTFPLYELNCRLDVSSHLIQSFPQNRVHSFKFLMGRHVSVSAGLLPC